MTTHERMEEEKLWLARYICKNGLAEQSEDRSAPLGYAVFRASNEQQVSQKLTAWLHLVLHEEASVESIEFLPANMLKRLTELAGEESAPSDSSVRTA